MLNQLRKKQQDLQSKDQSGFTIIEVMIVLAIAGLILLIVFLAVPALQRNARNTSRKNDIAGVLGALTEYVNNNNGGLPTTNLEFCTAMNNAKLGSGYVAPTAATTQTPTCTGTYSAGSFTFATNNTTVTPALGSVFINTGAKCIGGNFGGPNATARSLAAVYSVETGGGTQSICVES